jgi:phosphatidylserine synthase
LNPSLLKLGINLLTGIGAGLSVLSIPSAFAGEFRGAWLLMGVALVIDWVDGSLVRYLDIDPDRANYDGARLDEYADLMTYVIAPLMVAVASNQLPEGAIGYGLVVFVCVVSSLQSARKRTKTDRAFWGWPSYWNFVYFYGWGLGIGPWAIGGITVVLGLATFAPVPFPYPSRLSLQKYVLGLLGLFWSGFVLWYLLDPSVPDLYLALSLLFPIYYLVLPLFYYERLK